jgi:hypothetical protein
MPEPSMTCVLALDCEFDGQPRAYLGIDFPSIGGLPVAEIAWRQNDLFDIILRETMRFESRPRISEPFIVGVLQIIGSTQRLEFVPV